MFLLGATAVEDKLQEGVPDAIHTMQMAGIKVGTVRATTAMIRHADGLLFRSGCLPGIDKRPQLILVCRVG